MSLKEHFTLRKHLSGDVSQPGSIKTTSLNKTFILWSQISPTKCQRLMENVEKKGLSQE